MSRKTVTFIVSLKNSPPVEKKMSLEAANEQELHLAILNIVGQFCTLGVTDKASGTDSFIHFPAHEVTKIEFSISSIVVASATALPAVAGGISLQ